MRKVKLFIATSLDGYIADADGSVHWLEGQRDSHEDIDVYSEFVKDIDTILMGWNTYHQIITELSPNEWIYSDFSTYVFTHRQCSSTENVRFINENPVDFIKKLREEPGKDIWICGGARLIQQLVCEDFIDEYYITIIPILLGSGVRLFEKGEREIKLRLLWTQSYNGMADLVYERR